MYKDYQDADIPVFQRVEDLLSRMTPEEKVAQMVQIPYSEYPEAEAREWAKKGAGSFLHVLGDDAREIQKTAMETRLHIPVLFGIDAIHGHGLHPGATIFPTQLAAACSWDKDLIEKMGEVTAREVAADGLHWTFSPVLCLGRDLRWGRVNETFGEDPYLAGELGAAIIKGYQGDDLAADDSILACAKHYIGYGEALGGRDSCDTEMTFRKLREVFLPPFKKAIEAGCATVMTAYGSIDGTPLTASEKALRQILKDELGFTGFVVTDWDNVATLISQQRTAANMTEASCIAARSGNDMIMTTAAFYEGALEALRNGTLRQFDIDDAVRRILTIKFRMGLFEKPEKRADPTCFSSPEHLDASKKLAEASVVLLENRKGTLPLADSIQSIAVIGPNADDIRAQYGDWTYFTHPKHRPAQQAVPPYETVLTGIRSIARKRGIAVEYHRGCDAVNPFDSDLDGAVEVASKCSCIVLVLGDMIRQVGERKDRADLSLSGKQQDLFNRLRALGKPIITVLVASKPLAIEKVANETDALLVAFNGGMFGGLAVAEVLFGERNPSGHLPISFPRHSGQVPVYYNQLSGWHGGKYMDFEGTPLYPFGYGLSYTSFKYSEMQVSGDTVSTAVQNIGNVGGYEVVQLYFQDCISSVMTPQKQLIGFQKLYLQPNERKIVTFAITDDMLSLITPDEQRVTDPGEFILMVGSDSRDSSLLRTSIYR